MKWYELVVDDSVEGKTYHADTHSLLVQRIISEFDEELLNMQKWDVPCLEKSPFIYYFEDSRRCFDATGKQLFTGLDERILRRSSVIWLGDLFLEEGSLLSRTTNFYDVHGNTCFASFSDAEVAFSRVRDTYFVSAKNVLGQRRENFYTKEGLALPSPLTAEICGNLPSETRKEFSLFAIHMEHQGLGHAPSRDIMKEFSACVVHYGNDPEAITYLLTSMKELWANGAFEVKK